MTIELSHTIELRGFLFVSRRRGNTLFVAGAHVLERLRYKHLHRLVEATRGM